MGSINRFTLLLIAIAALFSGCATTTPDTAIIATRVPSLKVVTDCGTCKVRANVPTLIVEGYNVAASKSGSQVLSTEEAVITIREYSERSDGARLIAGAFAGKDEIKAVVTYNGEQFKVEDYYRNAWLGIESLARKIGELTYSGIK